MNNLFVNFLTKGNTMSAEEWSVAISNMSDMLFLGQIGVDFIDTKFDKNPFIPVRYYISVPEKCTLVEEDLDEKYKEYSDYIASSDKMLETAKILIGFTVLRAELIGKPESDYDKIKKYFISNMSDYFRVFGKVRYSETWTTRDMQNYQESMENELNYYKNKVEGWSEV